MSKGPLGGSDAISVRELADMRSAGKAHTVPRCSKGSEREFLIFANLEGALHVPMAEIPARAPMTSRRINRW